MKLPIDKTSRYKLYVTIFLAIALVLSCVGFLLVRNGFLIRYPSEPINQQFAQLKQSLGNWSADYLIQGCNSNKIQAGQISSWSCGVFSPKLKQTRVAVWSDGKVSLSEPITMPDGFVEVIKQKPNFNELSELISPQAALAQVYNPAQLQNAGEIIIYIGEATIPAFDNRYVWYVEERSFSDRDNNGIAKLVKESYIDAKTGILLK